MKLKGILFGFLCSLLIHTGKGQVSVNDPGFYLIDSLDLSIISPKDKELFDTTLVLYHSTENDTLRLNLLNHIINNCLNDFVWPEYNAYMKLSASQLLNQAENRPHTWVVKVVNILALAINNEGYMDYYKGDIDGALLNYHESLSLREKTGDTLGISEIYNNIGGIYYSQGENEKAIDYFKQSLVLKKGIVAPLSFATSLNNIGSIYNLEGDLDSAEHYFNWCLEIYEREKDQEGIGLCYHNLASVHAKRDDIEIARLFFLKSIQINESIDDFSMVSSSYTLLSKMYFKKNDLTQAELFAERALTYSEKLGYPDEIKDATEILHKIYRKRGRYKDALEMYDRHILMKDSILNSRIKQDIESRQLTYEFEKKAFSDSVRHVEENRLNEIKIQEQTAEIKRERYISITLLIGLLFLIIITGLIYIALKNKRRANLEIERQKQEVEHQRDLVQKQHAVTENQRMQLKAQNKEILDSITYAQRLQEAILPSTKVQQKLLPESFILYKPKDIVAGDFYWMQEVDDLLYFAVADCTGHGVPGAFVSLVCSNALNNVMLEVGAVHPKVILEKVTDQVVKTFEQSNHQIKDGMDIALCAFNKCKKTLQFAGAYTPLWIVSNRKTLETKTTAFKNEDEGPILHEIKGTRQPVGKYRFKTAFEGHEIQLEAEDTIYLISDGYADQFGGSSGKKFKYRQLKSLLLGIHHYPLDYQYRMLNTAFEKWKGELEQVDDVCLMGVRLNK